MNETIMILILLVGLVIALALLVLAYRGTTFLFRWAVESHGFIGLILFLGAWMFMSPVMAIVSIIMGVVMKDQVQS